MPADQGRGIVAKIAVVAARAPRSAAAALAAFQTLLLAVQPRRHTGDDPVRIAMLETLQAGHWPRDKFSVIMPALLSPFDRLADRLGWSNLVRDHSLEAGWLLWSLIVTAVLLRHRDLATVLTFQVFAFASMAAAYLLGFNAEAFSALVVSAGLLVALLGERRATRLAGWAVAALGVANVPAQLVGLAAVGAFLALRRRDLRFLLAPVVAFAVVVAEATWHNGHLSASKYTGPEGANSPLLPWGMVEGFGHPIVFGVVAIVASFGRGLVFYTPLLPAALTRPRTRLAEWSWCLGLFTVALIPLYARWWAWYGGVTFGPRFFMLGAIAGAFGATEHLCADRSLGPGRRALIVALAWLSAWVAVAGVVWSITPRAAHRCLIDGYSAEPLCWYSPEYSTLLAPLWDGQGPTTAQTLFAVGLAATVIAATLPHLRRSASAFRPWLARWRQPPKAS